VSNQEKVRAIVRAWEDALPKEPPATYEGGPTIDINLMAQIAINVLTDWHKR
jgi:hypothetical protein